MFEATAPRLFQQAPRKAESAEPGGHGLTDGGHYTVEKPDLPGGPLSTPPKATALACLGSQGDGSLLSGAGLPHTHPRPSLGGSRRGEIRATAHGIGNGESELPSLGERVQAGSDYRQLSSLPLLPRERRTWTSTPPAHRIVVYSL